MQITKSTILRTPISETHAKFLIKTLRLNEGSKNRGKSVEVDGVIYDSLTAACEDVGVSRPTLRASIQSGNLCNGKRVEWHEDAIKECKE